MRAVITGGGWAGCAAAIAARNAGAEVILLERTDMLLGTGLVGGIMRNNGRFTAAEEAIAMGAEEIFGVIDANCRHKNVSFPGHAHASLYDVARMEPAVRGLLLDKGVEMRFQARMRDVKMEGRRMAAAVLADGREVPGDVFLDCTGTAGPAANCGRYGNGCACCVLRCPSFGGRVTLVGQAGVQERAGLRPDGGLGAMSGSCKLLKDSLAPELIAALEQDGTVVIPLPEHLRRGEEALAVKACQQYALTEFAENIILLDTGHAKLMAPYYPLGLLRQVPGLEGARFEDPYAGGTGNSVRYMALSPHTDDMKVTGLDNVFCGGEKAGMLVGHTEAIITGTLAGHNAVRYALGRELLTLPRSLAAGDAIACANAALDSREGSFQKYTFSGSVYFRRMKELGLYTTDAAAIRARVERAGLTGVFSGKLA